MFSFWQYPLEWVSTFRPFSNGNIFHGLIHHHDWVHMDPVVTGLLVVLHVHWEQASPRDVYLLRTPTALEAPEVGSRVKIALHDVVTQNLARCCSFLLILIQLINNEAHSWHHSISIFWTLQIFWKVYHRYEYSNNFPSTYYLLRDERTQIVD